MASGSVIAAVIAKYATLTVANFPDASRPDIWLDEAPQEEGAGAQQRVPYTIIEDLGGEPKWTFSDSSTVPGQNGILSGKIAISVWYPSTTRDGLGDADQAMAAILWNGSIPDNRLGIAFMVPDLLTPQKGMSVIPGKDQRSYAGFNFQGRPVYVVRQEFKTQVALGGQGY